VVKVSYLVKILGQKLFVVDHITISLCQSVNFVHDCSLGLSFALFVVVNTKLLHSNGNKSLSRLLWS
jgi:hypothetical protein